MLNFKIFQELCGETFLPNVVIVTNMWDQIDLQVGEAREVELMREDTFFRSVFDQGAQIARNGNTVASAQNIIRLVLDNYPLPLRIQRELVEQHKDISATSASEELHREINAQIKKHQDEMRVVRDMRALKEEMHVLREELRAVKEMHVLKEEIRVLTEGMQAMRHENEETKRELRRMQREAETR